ncbi:MAG TPA: TIGR02147 family protein [Bdellovibrio sp.]|nr:TIGR02147 family protein [Bdellovibrio sp.]
MSLASAKILKAYFERKQKSRSGFSVRSFAKALKVSPSFASDIINGKKPIPLARISDLAKILELDQASLETLKQALAEETLRLFGIEIETKRTSKALEDYELASKNQFSVLTPWYNIAIMDLTTCANFKKDPQWIAQRLGLTKYQVEQSLQHLISHKLLKETSDGYKKVASRIRMSLNESHQEIRGYHTQMIEKAKAELTKTSKESFERREISGITIAGNPKNIAKARRRLVQAIHEVADILSEGESTDLFQINTQLFSLLKSDD